MKTRSTLGKRTKREGKRRRKSKKKWFSEILTEDQPEKKCDICLEEKNDEDHKLNTCKLCCASVHKHCYKKELLTHNFDSEKWFCMRCQFLLENFKQEDPTIAACKLCNDLQGIMVKVEDYGWVHINCANWSEKICFNDKNRDTMSALFSRPCKKRGKKPDKKTSQFPKTKHPCYLCRKKHDMLLKCDYHDCQNRFHARCGVKNGLIKKADLMKFCYGTHGKKEYLLFCEKHQSDGIANLEKDTKFVRLLQFEEDGDFPVRMKREIKLFGKLKDYSTYKIVDPFKLEISSTKVKKVKQKKPKKSSKMSKKKVLRRKSTKNKPRSVILDDSLKVQMINSSKKLKKPKAKTSRKVNSSKQKELSARQMKFLENKKKLKEVRIQKKEAKKLKKQLDRLEKLGASRKNSIAPSLSLPKPTSKKEQYYVMLRLAKIISLNIGTKEEVKDRIIEVLNTQDNITKTGERYDIRQNADFCEMFEIPFLTPKHVDGRLQYFLVRKVKSNSTTVSYEPSVDKKSPKGANLAYQSQVGLKDAEQCANDFSVIEIGESEYKDTDLEDELDYQL